MAHKPALNEEALAKLGQEKLAGLVAGEAARNPAFRKLVTAALAAAKGPKAVAAIVDKRLAGLDRGKSFVDWDKAKAFTADLAATLAAITRELAEMDPDAAAGRLIRFLSMAGRVLERVDDSSGSLQRIYEDAAAALPELLGRLDIAGKAEILDGLFHLVISGSCHLTVPVFPNILARLPPEAVEDWDARLAEAWQSAGPLQNERRDWAKRAKLLTITALRQAIADHRGDVDAFIALESGEPETLPNTAAIAERLCNAGRYKEALEWIRKRGRPGVKYMTYDDLANGTAPRDLADFARTRLEIQILDAMGEREAAQDLRWKTFEATLDAGILRDHIARLPDFAEFEVLDKAFGLAGSSKQRYRALDFFLEWPRLDLAAKLVLDRYGEWEGRYYEALLPAAEMLEADHPQAAAILYRALVDDILDRTRSQAYGHAARYLKTLDMLAEHESTEGKIDPHRTYRAALQKKHGRKSGFWSLVKEGK
jgi:hypothetical protein